MIVSFKHRFVFIKTQKTAGTSIEIALTPYCGPEDIITPMSLEDERSRVADGKVQARNYAADPAIEAAFHRAVMWRDRPSLTRIMRTLWGSREHFYNHMTGGEAQARLPFDFWQSALKFTIIRHPYERAVSLAYFNAGPAGASVDRLSTLIDKFLPVVGQDVLRYTRNGALIVDDVIRHPNLHPDLNRVLGKLGLPPVDDLPRAKGGYRRDGRPARDILSGRQKQMLQENCRLEFELFGYKP